MIIVRHGRELRPEWSFYTVDCLEKVFPDERPRPARSGSALSGFLGETLCAQIAFLPPAVDNLQSLPPLRAWAEGPLAEHVRMSVVELVPATLLAFDGHDDGYLRDTPGLYPDLLRPLGPQDEIAPAVGYWRSIWIDIQLDDPALAGQHELAIVVTDKRTDEQLYRTELPVTIHPVALPELDIINTHWLHADCLAEYYGADVFSEDHWEILDRYVAAAAQMRVNSILTPTWTPPLDTAVGHTRTPVQLIQIADDGSGYRFGFERLERWLRMCERHGIRTLEIAHLFTQWGARATPAIYVDTPAGIEHRFGWHIPATDSRYRDLMEQLIPQLRRYLDLHWGGDVFFHISDEPREEMLEDYRSARAVVADLLQGATVADALSDFTFVQDGVVETPIVATNHVRPFLESGTSPWVYHCVSQHRDVANRFIGLPSLRNRVLGRQLFVAGAPGFLHWGFNFWRTQFSLRAVNPFQDTCAGGAFPAGDAFIVYPGDDGHPLLSLRHRVFTQAMDDHRALQLLRELTDDATARSYVDQGGELRYNSFSYDPEHYLESRRQVDARILKEKLG
ncbi:DUF4091 domain-containing protein [Phytoactinopolyspora mesophila]|uniref:DUF4091 domain-containing protein n=1 Tax=Phytoactinopolyspora mesophila TaxID=2650750 RepID=A0A7K3M7P9_9ACTN|nr:DUF4091 domain-containing protein [Phytoactinopolyspora mesophila]NDL59210.1 DUF4091 domain-containing protein [Phytoactinopolyspora mesophila]